MTHCAVPLGDGPIDWNYRCYGRRDALNDLQRVRKAVQLDFSTQNLKQECSF